MNRPTIIAALVAAASTTAPLQADTVSLNDGSSVVGNITEITDAKLRIETTSLGTLEIDRANVAGFSTDEPRTIELESGERVIGRVINQGANLRIESESMSAVNVAPSKVAAAWVPGEESPAERQRREAHERRQWTGSLFFGLAGQTGTTEKLTFNGRLDLKQDLGDQRTFLYAQTRYSEENGTNSVNENIGGIRMEFDLDDNWYLWGKGEIENDQQEDIDLRASATAGVGYFVIREQDTEFKLRAGAGFIHESFGTGVNSNEGLFEAGYDYRNVLWDDIAFTHSLTYLPTFGDFTDDYRLNFDTAAEWAMGKSGDWRLRIGMQNKYDNTPVAGVERLDTWYYLNIGYAW